MDLQEGARAMQQLGLRVSKLGEPPREIMERVLKTAHEMILTRTLNGTDKLGNKFVPYSEGYYYVHKDSPYYSIAVSAGGRITKNGVVFDDRGYDQFKKGVTFEEVNLYVLGDMFNAVLYRVISPIEGEITIDDPKMAARAAAHEFGTANVPERPWWGVGLMEDERNELQEIVRAGYVEFANQIMSGEDHGNA